MKSLIWIPIALVLALSSPVFGNYGQMKEALNAYQPPAIFPDSDSGGPAASTEAKIDIHSNGKDDPSEDLSRLEPTILKPRFETALKDLGRDHVSAETLNRMEKLAEDEAALADLLGQQVRLEEIKAIALVRNPGLQAAREKVSGELNAFDQVMNLDDQLRQYSGFTAALDNRVGPIKAKDTVKMAYPSPGVTALKGKVVENRVAQEIETAAVTAKNLMLDVETVFWELDFISRSIEITQDTIGAFQRLKDVATVLYRGGKTSFQDVIKINIKLEELKENLVTLASKKKTVSIRLSALLDLPGGTSGVNSGVKTGVKTDVKTHVKTGVKIGTVDAAPLPKTLPPENPLYAAAREHRQELAALRFQIEKVSAMVEMAETMTQTGTSLNFSLSDAGLTNTTGSDAPKSAFATQTMAAMKNGSPARVWNGVDQPWLAQTQKTLFSLKRTLQAKENDTDSMVRQAWFTADRNHREYLLYKEKILPLAASALDVATREYESGSIPFSQAIGSYTDWLKIQLTIARKNSDYAISFAQLEQIVGKPLR